MDEPVITPQTTAPVEAPVQPAPQPVSSPAQPDPGDQVPPVGVRAKKLYDQLIFNGATKDDIGEFDYFNKAVQDPNRVSKVWDHLTKDLGINDEDLGGKDHFLSVFQPKVQAKIPTYSKDNQFGLNNEQDPVPLSFVSDPKVRQGMQDNIMADDLHDKAEAIRYSGKMADVFSNARKAMSSSKNNEIDLAEIGKAEDSLRDATKENAHYNFMNNTVSGKILQTLGTASSMVSHAVVDMTKMGAFLVNHLDTNPRSLFEDTTPEAQKKAFEVADNAADLGFTGLTKGDIQTTKDTPLLGTALGAVPIAATEGLGLLTKLPKTMFFLQFGGAGISALNDIEKTGVKVDPLVKNVFPILSGAVGSLFMGNVGETLAGKLPTEAAGKLSSIIAADTFMKAAQEDLGQDGVSELLKGNTQTYLRKLEQGSLNIASTYKSTLSNLAKFNVGNYIAKKASSAISDPEYKDPFPENNIGGLADEMYKTITKDAPIFAGFSMSTAKDAYTMAAPHTGFRDEITNAIINDPSEENVLNIKNQVNQFSALSQKSNNPWSMDQLNGTYQTIDKIAEAARKVPKLINPKYKDKMVSLLVGRKELQDQYDAYSAQNGNVDDSVKDIKTPEQQTYSDKIDQANDKLKAVVMGGIKAKMKYSMSTSGSPIKTYPDGTYEKISQGRYDMEKNEGSAISNSLFKEDNPTFVNYAKSIGATEQHEHDEDALTTSKDSAVGITLYPSGKQPGLVYITNLSVPEDTRGIGLAKQKLGDMTDKADEHNITLGIQLDDDEGYDKQRLKKLYEANGFTDNGSDYMGRKPNSVSKNEQPTERKKISDADAPIVKELSRNLRETGKPGIGVEPAYEHDYSSPSDLTDTELDNGNKYIVSRDADGRVNGAIEVSYNGKDGPEDKPTDVKVAVDENSRRKGIATALFKHAEDNGIDLSEVRGRATTDAGQALYESNLKNKGNEKENAVNPIEEDSKAEEASTDGGAEEKSSVQPTKTNKIKSKGSANAGSPNIVDTGGENGSKTADVSTEAGSGVTEPIVSDIPETELSQLKKEYQDKSAKLEKVRKSIELHNSGEKELDDATLQAKKIQRDKFSKDLKDIEAKISASNDAYYAAIGKHVPEPNGAVGVGKMASIDAQIKEVSGRLGKNLRMTANSGGGFQNVGDLILLGKLYVQKGIVKFSDFVARLREDYRTQTGKELEMTDKEIASSVYKPSIRSMEDPTVNDEDIQERGFGKRMSGSVPEETQNYIDVDPGHDYERQRLDKLKAILENTSDEGVYEKMGILELFKHVTPETNDGVLAAGEALKRALSSNDQAEYQAIFEMLDKTGTTLGQLVRQFAEIKGGDPKFMVNAFEKKLSLSGRFLTPEQKDRLNGAIEDYAKKSIKAKDLFLKYVDSLDDADGAIYRSAKKEADLAFINFAKVQSDYDMRGFFETAGSIMKGNLLTPVSQIKNPLYNLFVNPLMIAAHNSAAVLDKVVTQFGYAPSITTSLAQVRAQLNGFVSGIGTAGRMIRYGVYPGEETKLDSYRGLRPLDSMMQVITGKDIPQSKNKIQYYKDRFATKLLEATFGLPAEASYRLLAIGDRPFYESSYNRKLVEIAELRGLKGDDYKRFLLNPDKEAMDEAKIAGNKSTFQHDSVLAKFVTKGLNGAIRQMYKGDLAPLAFVLDAVVPFVRTPVNVVYSYGKWLMPQMHVPVIAFDAYSMNRLRGDTLGAIENAKKNGATKITIDSIKNKAEVKMTKLRGQFLLHISEAAISVALRSSALWLVGTGVYSGIVDPDKKKLGLQREESKPNSINTDALKRGIQTGDYSQRDGDSYLPLDAFGMFGAAVATQYNIKKLEQEAGVDDSSKGTVGRMLDDVNYGGPSVVQYAFDQSFLKGANTMIQALSTGDYSQIAPNIAASMSSVVIPNTWSAVARANREFLLNKRPDKSGDVDSKTWEAIKNTIAERTQLHPDLPEMRGMFGTPIKQTPEGRNPYVYQLIDAFKMGPVNNDPVVNEIVDLYKITQDDSFVPLPPNQDYMIYGDKRILTAQETIERQELVGQARYNAYRMVMQTAGYKTADVNIKVIILANQVLPLATREGELMFEARYIKNHPDIGNDIIKVKKGEEKNNGRNKEE